MKKRMVFRLACLLVAILSAVSPALAVDWDFKGSLGEGEHTHYVPPVSNPFLNETPYITTEARPIYMYNDVPGGFLAVGGEAGGGYFNLLALQLRLALTDRLGFIINKNGYMDFNHKSSKFFTDDGLANIAFGLKYALLSDPAQATIVTAGFTYEMPSGTLKTGFYRLQGDGNGFINLFVTAAKSYDKLSLQSMLGTKITLDQERSATWLNYAAHVDYEILPGLFPLMEFNFFLPINDPRQNQFNYEGLDLVSIGGADPQGVVTLAGGARYKLSKTVVAGMVYEAPLTNDKDITDWRVTADLVFYY